MKTQWNEAITKKEAEIDRRFQVILITQCGNIGMYSIRKKIAIDDNCP